jgi:hypothetical protein
VVDAVGVVTNVSYNRAAVDAKEVVTIKLGANCLGTDCMMFREDRLSTQRHPRYYCGLAPLPYKSS